MAGKKSKRPLYEIVAENLIEQLQKGTVPWQKTWQPGAPEAGLPRNPVLRKRYKGINAVQLASRNYTDPRWMTYDEARQLGGQVRARSTGTPVLHWRFSRKQTRLDEHGNPVIGADGKPVTERVRLERPELYMTSVFNAEQMVGLPPLEKRKQAVDPGQRAERILQASAAVIRHGGQERPFYDADNDTIHLPDRSQFASDNAYHASALRQLCHWTGHPSRLNRDIAHPFGSEGHAREELRAGIASMILGHELGISPDPGQARACTDTWIRILKEDPMELSRAARDAEYIRNHLLGLERQQVREQAPAELSAEAEQSPPAQTQAADVAEAWTLKHLQAGSLPTALGKADERQLERVAEVLQDMQPARLENPFWSRHPLPADEDFHNKIQAAAAQLSLRRFAADRVIGELSAGDPPDRREQSRTAAQDRGAQGGHRVRVPSTDAREEFAQALKEAGAVLTDGHPVMDGKTHRLQAEGDGKGDKAIRYRAHLDGAWPAGFIKNYRTQGSGEYTKWVAKGYYVDGAESKRQQNDISEKRAQRNEEKLHRQEAAAEHLEKQRAELPVAQSTPYLRKKGLDPDPHLRTDRKGNSTQVPGYDVNGKLWTVQYIQPDGSKPFAKDSRVQGSFHPVGGFDALEKAPVLVIAEGYATAASLSRAMNQGTVAAFGADNLEGVARALHEKYPDKPILIAGDDDRHREAEGKVNKGRLAAEEAARAVGGKAVFPVFAPGEAAQKLADGTTSREFKDFNDLENKSVLGREGLVRQARAALGVVLRDPGQRQSRNQEREVKPRQKQERPRKRGASIA